MSANACGLSWQLKCEHVECVWRSRTVIAELVWHASAGWQ